MKTALSKLIKIEQESRAFGFDWPNTDMILDQAISECHEIREAINNQESLERIQEEIGDLLHAAISLCDYANFDVEETLELTYKKFNKRMKALKKETARQGLENLNGQSMAFMLELWEKAKKA